MDLNTIWFLLIGILLTGYALLDGFDFGVGAFHLFARKEDERRILLNSIGPVWDGNEVWLVVGGGALFAAFPHVYATVFSGFYLAFILLLFALIFRAASIEFRGKLSSPAWQGLWDTVFSFSSILAPILIGVAFGNVVWGVPIDPEKEFAGTFLSLLHPYSLLMGVTVLALFMMHGALYLWMKTEGDLEEKVRKWAGGAFVFFSVCFGLVTAATFRFVPRMITAFGKEPLFCLVPLLAIFILLSIPWHIKEGRKGAAFISSSAVIIFLMMLFGIGMYPDLIASNPNPERSLTIYNAASSEKTLSIMLTIALIGMPLVLTYVTVIYRVFRGKVKLDSSSY